MKEKKWYVVYAKPRWEKKIDERLLHKGIESWCPLKKVEKQWSDRKKIIEEPIFKSYVFVRINEEERLSVLQTDGVLQFVHYLKKPAVIRDNEIDEIKSFLLIEDAKIELIDINNFKENTKVKVRKGIFTNAKGTVLRSGKKKLYVMLESLESVMVVEFKAEYLEKV